MRATRLNSFRRSRSDRELFERQPRVNRWAILLQSALFTLVNSTRAHCKRPARNVWPPLRRNSGSKRRFGAACSRSSQAPHRDSPSWRAANHRVRFVGRIGSALGRERRIRSERAGRRFHSRAGIRAAHGDQSVKLATVPMGRGEKHLDSDRGQSSRGHVAFVLRRQVRGRRLGV